MKTTILILNTNEWSFEGKTGVSAYFLKDDYKLFSSTVKDENLKLVQSTKLPATFEADLDPKAAIKDGKPIQKYSILSIKLLKEIAIFTKV